MQRQIGQDLLTTPRLRRRRQMRPFSILFMMGVVLITTFIIFAYVGTSVTWHEDRGPREKDPLLGNPEQPKADQMAINKEHETLQAAPGIFLETEHFLSEMARRMEAVRNVCRADGGDTTLHEAVTAHIAADKKEKFLYCVVPHPYSAARLAYQLQLSDLWSPQFDADGGLSKNPFPPPKDFNPGLQEDLYVTRFLVTRHPLQRLLECYTGKLESGKDTNYYELYGKAMVTSFRERPRDMSALEVVQLLSKVDDDAEREQTLGNLYANPKGPTFTEFVQYVVNATLPDDVLWRPIHQHCAPCSINYNYILSFEDLSEEGDQLMMMLKATLPEKSKKEGALVGPPSEEASCSYFSQLSSALMLQLKRRF